MLGMSNVNSCDRLGEMEKVKKIQSRARGARKKTIRLYEIPRTHEIGRKQKTEDSSEGGSWRRENAFNS